MPLAIDDLILNLAIRKMVNVIESWFNKPPAPENYQQNLEQFLNMLTQDFEHAVDTQINAALFNQTMTQIKVDIRTASTHLANYGQTNRNEDLVSAQNAIVAAIGRWDEQLPEILEKDEATLLASQNVLILLGLTFSICSSLLASKSYGYCIDATNKLEEFSRQANNIKRRLLAHQSNKVHIAVHYKNSQINHTFATSYFVTYTVNLFAGREKVRTHKLDRERRRNGNRPHTAEYHNEKYTAFWADDIAAQQARLRNEFTVNVFDRVVNGIPCGINAAIEGWNQTARTFRAMSNSLDFLSRDQRDQFRQLAAAIRNGIDIHFNREQGLRDAILSSRYLRNCGLRLATRLIGHGADINIDRSRILFEILAFRLEAGQTRAGHLERQQLRLHFFLDNNGNIEDRDFSSLVSTNDVNLLRIILEHCQEHNLQPSPRQQRLILDHWAEQNNHEVIDMLGQYGFQQALVIEAQNNIENPIVQGAPQFFRVENERLFFQAAAVAAPDPQEVPRAAL